ncbi:uncharacterized protein LOC128868467 [Anastrepha ludens]|uniref:uncharacterized protein LOC128868467 n=1 Tax=Anastrepha ludens TaxID=28586 RepID=UPI0023B07F29|nr:uncharacterized protein LOC128868467 [Anastrepha ludens]
MHFKRNSVIALYLADKSRTAIVRELEHLKVNKVLIYRTVTRYSGTGSIANRHGGRNQKTATSREMVQKAKKRLEQNPQRRANQMAKELKLSDFSISRILKNDLKVKTYDFQKSHDLTPKQQQVRLVRAKELPRLTESGQFPNTVFSDETTFQIEQFVNSQNDRVYLTDRTYLNLSHRLATRRQRPPPVMVWALCPQMGALHSFSSSLASR